MSAREASSEPARPSRPGSGPVVAGRRIADLVATIVLLAVGVVLALVAGWGIVFLSLRFQSCSVPGNQCDEALGGAVVYAGPVLVALVVVLAVVFSVFRLVRHRLAWPIALTGIVGVVAVFLGAVVLVDGAVTHGV